jgi:hypothetical protein
MVRFDDAGAPISEIDTGLALFTFFAPARGTSVSYRTASNLRTVYFPDGSAIATITGVVANIHQPGGPR